MLPTSHSNNKISLNGVFLVQKPVFPYEIFTQEEKAMAWIQEKKGRLKEICRHKTVKIYDGNLKFV